MEPVESLQAPELQIFLPREGVLVHQRQLVELAQEPQRDSFQLVLELQRD